MTAFERQQRLLDSIRQQPGIRAPEFACRERRPASSRTRMRGSAIGDGQRLSDPPCATFDQFTHLFTDSQFDPQWIQPLQEFSMALTVCSGNTAMADQPTGGKRGTSGFANLTENSPFCVELWRSQQLPV